MQRDIARRASSFSTRMAQNQMAIRTFGGYVRRAEDDVLRAQRVYINAML